MAARTTLSLDDFLKLPEREEDGTHYELEEGQLITLSPSNGRHAFVEGRIVAYLDRVLDPGRFTILCGDAGFILEAREERSTVRGADIAVRQVPAGHGLSEGMLHEAPFVAIEIVSPSNTAEYTRRKTLQYLKAGGQEVWVVYPDTKETHVFRAGQAQPEIYTHGQRFDSCLGISIDTKKLFSR